VTRRKQTGTLGEDLACRALVERGYEIVARNWRPHGVGLRGEIDIVARDGDCWAFVEVKTRRGRRVEPAPEALTGRQMARLTQLGLQYLAEHGLHRSDWRIDLVAVELAGDGSVGQLHLVQALVAD